MCDFHSCVFRLIGQEAQMLHDPSNSHSEMIARAKWKENEPNRRIIIFETEWDGEGPTPTASMLIRNNGECPSVVEKAIVRHYTRLAAALTDGANLNDYFGDHTKYADVWQVAMRKGFIPDFSDVKVFPGNLDIREGASLTANALTEVTGYLDISKGASLTAPKLKR